jgi:F-box domain
MTCWSGLVSDIVEHITSFLPLPDYHRFSAVCRNWRSVAKQKRYSPAPQLPWLVLGDERGTGKRKFYNLSEERLYAINIPELRGRYICGSSHGWLLAVDVRLKGILINPFTRELYELPPFPHRLVYTFFDDPNAMGNLPTEDQNCPSKRMQVRLVFKAVLSDDPKERPDFTLMILVGVKNIPAFWKPGDPSWTVIRVQKGRMDDVIFFDGRFIFVTAANELLALDLQPHPKLTEIGVVLTGRTCFVALSYLVDFSGVVLLVERSQLQVERSPLNLKTTHFKVIEVFGQSGVSVGEINALLFLGTNASIAIDASKLRYCCKANLYSTRSSIYFTDVTHTLSDERYSGDDMGLFNTKDEAFDATFHVPQIDHTRVGTPIWLTPNPW